MGLDNSFTCNNANTCVFNTQLSVVGCQLNGIFQYATSCVPYSRLSNCDSSCMGNSHIMKW
jgi:hypothetical protein